MSSSGSAPVETAPAKTPTRRGKKRIGRIRKLDKRREPKPDGRYLIYYRPA